MTNAAAMPVFTINRLAALTGRDRRTVAATFWAFLRRGGSKAVQHRPYGRRTTSWLRPGRGDVQPRLRTGSGWQWRRPTSRSIASNRLKDEFLPIDDVLAVVEAGKPRERV
jgi:hypothetical protein